MVAAAVARRAGVADELLDEVRLAIGEACGRAVALHRRRGLTALIDVTMSDGLAEPSAKPAEPEPPARRGFGRAGGGGSADRGAPATRFTVLVTDRGSAEAARVEQQGASEDLVAAVAATRPGDDTGRNGLDEDMLTLGVGLTLLSGLVNDLAVEETADGTGTEVRMSWPVTPEPSI
jgi:hypothetical protein